MGLEEETTGYSAPQMSDVQAGRRPANPHFAKIQYISAGQLGSINFTYIIRSSRSVDWTPQIFIWGNSCVVPVRMIPCSPDTRTSGQCRHTNKTLLLFIVGVVRALCDDPSATPIALAVTVHFDKEATAS
jgi:hypothetical protein